MGKVGVVCATLSVWSRDGTFLAFWGVAGRWGRPRENLLFIGGIGITESDNALMRSMLQSQRVVYMEKKMAKSIPSVVFASTLKDAKADVVIARNKVVALTSQRKPIGRLLRKIAKCIDFNDRCNYVHMWVSDNQPVISITLHSLDGFKSLRLESALWLLEEIGTLKEQKEYPSCLNRDYKYEVDGYKVFLCAYVSDDSPTCRKIVVGTETVTTPKYAIQCD